MKIRRFIYALIAVLVFMIGFSVVPGAYAKLKVVSAFYVWDDTSMTFKNSTVDLRLDGSVTHVIHELGFDNDLYNPAVAGSTTKAVCDRVAALSDPAHAQHSQFRNLCPDARNTRYAGVLELAMPYDKIEAGGTARAFAYTANWSLIDCDLDSNQAWNNTDLEFNTIASAPVLLKNWDTQSFPINGLTLPGGTTQDEFFKILAIDVKTPCSTGNCANEIVTTVFLDLDIDKSNTLTAAGDGIPVNASGSLPGGRVCFFAKAYPVTYPTNPASVAWGGNAQARITAGGGAKTVNLSTQGPTAISLASLTAQTPAGISPGIWLFIVLLLSAVAFLLIRGSRRKSF